MIRLTYRSREEGQSDRAQQEKLLLALDAAQSQLRRDECGWWVINGRHGSIQTWGDGTTWVACIRCRSARHWTITKRRLGFMTVTQDGDDEGCLRLALPTTKQAQLIRDLLGLRKRREMTPAVLAGLEMARANSPLSARRTAEAPLPGASGCLSAPTRLKGPLARLITRRRLREPFRRHRRLERRRRGLRGRPTMRGLVSAQRPRLRAAFRRRDRPKRLRPSVWCPRTESGLRRAERGCRPRKSDEPVDLKLAVTYRPVAALIPYARNARTHSDEQIAQIAGSIRAFGFTNPLLVDGENGIIAGHGRLLAARKLGMAEVPVIELAGMSEAERRAYIIADNKLALNAGWDDGLLRAEFEALEGLGFDLNLTGFSGDELAGLMNVGSTGLTDPDEVPDVPLVPVSRPGDLWRLGDHRLLCGDSTIPSDVDRVLAGVLPHLMVTDPPYGVSYDPSWRKEAGLADGSSLAKGKVLNDDRADWREAWALFPGDVAYVWHGALHAAEVAGSLDAAGFAIRSQIIWDKTRLVIGRGDYHWQHEPALYCVRKGKPGHWAGGRNQTTVWAIPHRKSASGHGTQKPVECMKRPIENNSSPGQAVYEPFSGSGTTIIGAEMTGRSCHAIELSPAYVDVAIKRWQAFTGEEARLDADGRTFAAVAEARGESAGVAPSRIGEVA